MAESDAVPVEKPVEMNAIITQVSQTREEMKHAVAQGKSTATGQESIDVQEHQWSADEVAKHWKTDLIKGLTEEQVATKFQKYGANMLTPPKTTPWYCLFFQHLTGFFSLLLWLAALLCFIAYGIEQAIPENLYLGVVLVIVTVLTGIFSFYQDYQSAAVMAGFKNMLPPRCMVTRGGNNLEIDAKELVPGDLVNVTAGERVPADLYCIEANNYKVDNSSLTGESEPIKRKPGASDEDLPLESHNLSFYGTLVVSGNAKNIVIRTADETVIGKIAKLTTATGNVQTPIAIEIEHFIHIVSAVAVFLGVTFLIIGVIKGTEFVNNMVFCIGIIVANVPEGLLATVTVSLTLTAKRMASKKVLVKNLESVETLGSTNTIASDKTGTLTCNRMTVNHIWYDLQSFEAAEGNQKFDRQDKTFTKLLQVATLCNNTEFKANPENMSKPVLDRSTTGDASETAMIKFCEPLYKIKQMRAENERLAEVPFNSHNKFHVTIQRNDNNPDLPKMLLMKGAPERIWNRCKHILINGEVENITDEITATYTADLRKLMFQGERVLGLCCLDLDAQKYPDGFEFNTGDADEYNFPLDNMVFIGLVALIDPPRAAVPGAVLLCQKAGIKVIMVTGDHPDTAEAISKQVNIIRGRTRRDVAFERGVETEDVALDDPEITAYVCTGAMLETMSDKDLDDILDFKQIVFARTSPEQKLIIVQGLQRKTHIRRGYPADSPKPIKHVVAVTGDGVNDSPAIKKADIGIAMGIAGTEVAKDAADMVLLNDNFASIVDGVEEGRLIFDNLKKSIAYTLSSNIPEISPFLIYILASIPLPLPTVLILCIDLGTDMIPAISLAYEGKESNIMSKPPRDSRVDRLVTAKLVNFSYLQVGVFQAAAGFFAYIVVLHDYGFGPQILPNLAPTWEGYLYMNTSATVSKFNTYSVWSDDTQTGSMPSAVKVLNYTSKLFPAGAEFNQQFGDRGENGMFCYTDRISDPSLKNSPMKWSTDMINPNALGGKGCAPLNKCIYGWKVEAIAASEGGDCLTYGNTYCDSPLSSLSVAVNPCHMPVEALAHAQTAFFISIIVVQWADLTCCKTRTLSIMQQGMWNNFLNFGLFFETALGAFLCYCIPLNGGLGTRPIRFEHWCPALPFSALILVYDEGRKYLLRGPPEKEKDNWVYQNTYY